MKLPCAFLARIVGVLKFVLDNAVEIAPELTGHGLPLSKCEAYNRSMTNTTNPIEIF